MEVEFSGTVSSEPHFFFGTRTHCVHEAFDVQTRDGPVEVIDNVDLAPRVGVHVGDAVRVRGEMVHDPGREDPIVHWTHHDPAHRHTDGFIRWHGKTYA